jgi:hypothetical protein
MFYGQAKMSTQRESQKITQNILCSAFYTTLWQRCHVFDIERKYSGRGCICYWDCVWWAPWSLEFPLQMKPSMAMDIFYHLAAVVKHNLLDGPGYTALRSIRFIFVCLWFIRKKGSHILMNLLATCRGIGSKHLRSLMTLVYWSLIWYTSQRMADHESDPQCFL